MKYVVMECSLSYAVVLDEAGRFLKVANLHYEVGQTVTDVIEMKIPEKHTGSEKGKARGWIYSIAAAAACLALVFSMLFQGGAAPYASVYLTINPEVRIDINQKDMVVGLDGINPDGDDLIEGYRYRKKPLDQVMDELMDRAIEMGYLYEGGQITLTLDAEDDQWIVSHSKSLTEHLNDYLKEKISVTIEIENTRTINQEIIIPVAPETAAPETTAPETTVPETTAPAEGDSDYGADSGQSDYGQSDYGAEPEDDGQSDYGAEPEDDGQSDYGAEPEEDGQSDYEEDGGSDYEEEEEDDD